MNKVGRNDPCPCGRGKKYKQCCMRVTDSPAIDSAPPLPSAQLLHLALARHMEGKLDEAEAVYQDVLKREPRNAEAWHLTGVAAGDRGNLVKALEHIDKAIALNGDNHTYHANRGRMLMMLNRHAEAEPSYRRALSLKETKGYYDSLGIALSQQEKYSQAEVYMRKALAIDPDFAGALRNLADLLQFQGRNTEAFEHYQRALALQPENADLYSNIGTLQQGEGDYVAALANFRKAVELAPDNRCAHDNVVYNLSFHLPPQEYLHAVRARAAELQRQVQQPPPEIPAAIARAGSKLRIGFVSGDLRIHPVGIFLESILAQLRNSSLELIAYATVPPVDDLTRRIRPYFAEWYTIDKTSDADAARQIVRDRIDILVDLNGYTANNRLGIFAAKPAPVQVTWLGYWASTGLEAIDYILADRHSLPPEEAIYYVEQPWYLPDTRLCFTPPHDAGAIAPPPLLRNGYPTFGCFNNPTKITDTVIAAWARILARIPESRLLLKSKQFVDDEFSARMRARLAAQGVDPSRILLQPQSPRAEYFDAYGEIDIALDPFPYTGGATSVDGVWMGVPFVTLRGDRIIARQGECILHNIGLPDWIAADVDEYVEIAVTHAADLQRLERLRGELRERLQRSPLCDAARFADHLVAAFRGMWQIATGS